MNKEFVITQEELDMLEAIRQDIYLQYVTDDNIADIIKAGSITEPLWKIINKKRDEIIS